MANVKNNNVNKITYFFLISHGLPLLVTGVLMIIGKSVYINNIFFGKLIYLSMLSPTLATFYIIFNFYNRKRRYQYWQTVVDYKRIDLRLFILVLIFPFLVKFFAAFAAANFNWVSLQFSKSAQMSLSYALFLLFFGPITEELGWRGVALPELLERFSFTVAVLFLGFMWAIWHLPLFFIVDSYHYQLGLASPAFWNYMLSIISISVLYGAVYYKAGKSVLIVILFHYLDNLVGETFLISFQAKFWESILRALVAILVLWYQKRIFKGIKFYRL